MIREFPLNVAHWASHSPIFAVFALPLPPAVVNRSTGSSPAFFAACSSAVRRLPRSREPPTNLRGFQLGAAEAAPAA